MERLTKRVGQHVYYIGFDCNNPGSGDIPAEMDAGEVRKVLHRLAAYEDTGLEPEEVKDLQLEVATLKTIEKMYDGLGRPDHLRELAQAEKDGRLVVLPCKVGDLLYEVDLPEYGVITCKVLSIMYYKGPMFHVPGNEVVSSVDVEVEVIEGHGKGSSYNFEIGDFGKTVFLTRQEAEETLRKEAEHG